MVLTRVRHFCFLLLPLLMCIGCGPQMSESDAESLAINKLKEYSKKEGISFEQFGKPEVSSDEKHPWIFDFQSNGSPRHLVRIYVNRNGDVEINRMIE